MSIRLERLSIRNFGPLQELQLEPGDLTVIHGPNEAGKTSCIDALVRALHQRVGAGRAKLLENVRNEGGYAEGEVSLSLRPSDGGPLLALLREHPSLARLFIIRDGDARLEAGRAWLDGIRNRLIGIDLAKVAERVRTSVGLDPDGKLRESRADERQRLSERLTGIEALLADLGSLGALSDDLHALEQYRSELRARITRLREAERFQRWAVARDARSALRTAQDSLRDLERFLASDLDAWRDAVSEIRESAALAKSAEGETARWRETVSAATEELRRKEVAIERARSQAEEIGRRDLTKQVARARALRDSAETWKIWRVPFSVAGVLLLVLGVGAGLIALGRIGSVPFVAGTAAAIAAPLVAGAATLAGLLAGGLAIFGARRMSQATVTSTEVLALCSKVLPPSPTLDDCAARLQMLETSFARLQTEKASAAERKRGAEATLETALRREAERLRGVDAAQRRVAEIRDRVRLAELGQLEEKLRLRTQAEAAQSQARQTLATVLGAGVEDFTAVDALQTEDPGIAPDSAALASSEAELEALEIRLTAMARDLQARRERPLTALNLPDLGAAEAERIKLREAILTIDREVEAARLALSTLRTLEQDLDRPLREALGASRGAAGDYLSRMTKGRYRAILLAEDGKLSVERGDGVRLPAEALSRGARDQLALAIRVALVRRLLGVPGFLVLDDAFMSADPERRQALIESILDLSGDGWQIIYLTFDPALRDQLVGHGASAIDLAPPRRLAASAS